MATASLQVFPDATALAAGAADAFARRAAKAVRSRGRFVVALSGGATPRRTYELLATPEFRDRVGWPRAVLFQVDERVVPRSHPDSNFAMIRDTLTSRVALPPDGFLPFETELGDPEAVAARGEARIRECFGLRAGELPRFDLILLGMGTDGHTASLFPGSAAVEERRRLVAPVPMASGHARVTLTLPVINNAPAVIFLVSGKQKAAVLRAVIRADAAAAALPAARVRALLDPPTWLVDAEAASLL